MRIGHASGKANQRTLDNAKLPYDKADVERALSNCGCDDGLLQSRQASLVSPHRSVISGRTIQVDMFYPADFPAKSKSYILIIGRFYRFTMCPLLASHSAKDVADAILERWVLVFGRPRKILTDSGSGASGPE